MSVTTLEEKIQNVLSGKKEDLNEVRTEYDRYNDIGLEIIELLNLKLKNGKIPTTKGMKHPEGLARAVELLY